jgi:hypothetical protein
MDGMACIRILCAGLHRRGLLTDIKIKVHDNSQLSSISFPSRASTWLLAHLFSQLAAKMKIGIREGKFASPRDRVAYLKCEGRWPPTFGR